MTTWEKLPEESARAYRAFSLYRDLGPSRTLRAVAESLYGTRWKYGKRTVEKWSSRFDWVERAQALDARDDAIRLEAIEMHKLRQADDTAERVKALREQNLCNEEKAAEIEAKYLDYAERLIDKLPLVQQTTVREEDGKPVVYVIQPATKNAVLDAARLHKIATRSEPSRVDMRVRNYDLTNATEKQLDRLLAGEDPDVVLGPDWPTAG